MLRLKATKTTLEFILQLLPISARLTRGRTGKRGHEPYLRLLAPTPGYTMGPAA